MSDADRQQGDAPRGGEGDHEAARRYNERAEEFAGSESAERAKAELGQESEAQRREDEAARRTAAERAAEKDPAVTRDYGKPEK